MGGEKEDKNIFMQKYNGKDINILFVLLARIFVANVSSVTGWDTI